MGRDDTHRGQEIADQAGRAIHLVDEQHMGNVILIEKPENRRQHGGALGCRLTDHDGGIGAHQGVTRLGGELDRAGTVDECEGDAFIVRRGG